MTNSEDYTWIKWSIVMLQLIGCWKSIVIIDNARTIKIIMNETDIKILIICTSQDSLSYCNIKIILFQLRNNLKKKMWWSIK